ncbi:hypothetical protein ACJIZ3_001523 [Penstemon smallii]|uniref:Secreted protein n=1 Tax=Penstemon smallii TaxID=265156 RepID=A0ABD3U6Q5_9LAMI
MYAAVLFLGVQNATSMQPVVAIERIVFYRERACSRDVFSYALCLWTGKLINSGQLPNSFGTFSSCTSHCCTSHSTGCMMTVAITPNHNIAAIISSAFYGFWNLFSRFLTFLPLLGHYMD